MVLKELKSSSHPLLIICPDLVESCLHHLNSWIRELNRSSIITDIIVTTQSIAVQGELEGPCEVFNLQRLLPAEINALFANTGILEMAANTASDVSQCLTHLLSHPALACLVKAYFYRTRIDLPTFLSKYTLKMEVLLAELLPPQYSDTCQTDAKPEGVHLEAMVLLVMDEVSLGSKRLLEVLSVTANGWLPAEVVVASVQLSAEAKENEILVNESFEELNLLGLINVDSQAGTVQAVFVPQVFQKIILSRLKVDHLSTFKKILLDLVDVLSQNLPCHKAFNFSYRDVMLFPHAAVVTDHCMTSALFPSSTTSLLNLMRFSRELYCSLDMLSHARRISEALVQKVQMLAGDDKLAVAREEIRVKLADVDLFTSSVVTINQVTGILHAMVSVLSSHNLCRLASTVLTLLQTIVDKLNPGGNEHARALLLLIDGQMANGQSQDALCNLEKIELSNLGSFKSSKAGIVNFLSRVGFDGMYTPKVCYHLGSSCFSEGFCLYSEAFIQHVLASEPCDPVTKLAAQDTTAVMLRRSSKLTECLQAYQDLQIEAKRVNNCEFQIRALLGQAEVRQKRHEISIAFHLYNEAFQCSCMQKNRIKTDLRVEVMLRFANCCEVDMAKAVYDNLSKECISNVDYQLHSAICYRAGELCNKMGDVSMAKVHFIEAAEAAKSCGESFILAQAHWSLGRLLNQEQNHQDSDVLAEFQKAAKYAQQVRKSKSDSCKSSTVGLSEMLHVDEAVSHYDAMVHRGGGLAQLMRSAVASCIEAHSLVQLQKPDHALECCRYAAYHLYRAERFLANRDATLQQEINSWIEFCGNLLVAWQENLLRSLDWSSHGSVEEALVAAELHRTLHQPDIVVTRLQELRLQLGFDFTIEDIRRTVQSQKKQQH